MKIHQSRMGVRRPATKPCETPSGTQQILPYADLCFDSILAAEIQKSLHEDGNEGENEAEKLDFTYCMN